MTDISNKQALKNRIEKGRRRLSLLSVFVPLAFIFSAIGAAGDGPGRQISAYVVGDIATLESIGFDPDDVILYEVDMSEGAVRVHHAHHGGQDSEMTFMLQRVVVFDKSYGTHDVIESHQIADSTYSVKTYDTVLYGVDGQGLEVEWHLVGDSKLELHLELFDEKVVHDGVEYGPACALMRFELYYPEEGFDLEISMEADVQLSHGDLSWQVGTSFVEISSSLPSSLITLGLGKEFHHENTAENIIYSHEEVTGGISFTADFNSLGELTWDGFINVDIFPFDGEEVWHPSVDIIAFGVTAFFTAVAVTLLKLRFSKPQ